MRAVWCLSAFSHVQPVDVHECFARIRHSVSSSHLKTNDCLSCFFSRGSFPNSQPPQPAMFGKCNAECSALTASVLCTHKSRCSLSTPVTLPGMQQFQRVPFFRRPYPPIYRTASVTVSSTSNEAKAVRFDHLTLRQTSIINTEQWQHSLSGSH